jgi:hypothetical protein
MGVYYFILLIGTQGLGAICLYVAIKTQLNDWEVGEYKRFKSWVVWLRLMLFAMVMVGLLGLYCVSSKNVL